MEAAAVAAELPSEFFQLLADPTLVDVLAANVNRSEASRSTAVDLVRQMTERTQYRTLLEQPTPEATKWERSLLTLSARVIMQCGLSHDEIEALELSPALRPFLLSAVAAQNTLESTVWACRGLLRVRVAMPLADLKISGAPPRNQPLTSLSDVANELVACLDSLGASASFATLIEVASYYVRVDAMDEAKQLLARVPDLQRSNMRVSDSQRRTLEGLERIVALATGSPTSPTPIQLALAAADESNVDALCHAASLSSVPVALLCTLCDRVAPRLTDAQFVRLRACIALRRPAGRASAFGLPALAKIRAQPDLLDVVGSVDKDLEHEIAGLAGVRAVGREQRRSAKGVDMLLRVRDVLAAKDTVSLQSAAANLPPTFLPSDSGVLLLATASRLLARGEIASARQMFSIVAANESSSGNHASAAVGLLQCDFAARRLDPSKMDDGVLSENAMWCLNASSGLLPVKVLAQAAAVHAVLSDDASLRFADAVDAHLARCGAADAHVAQARLVIQVGALAWQIAQARDTIATVSAAMHGKTAAPGGSPIVNDLAAVRALAATARDITLRIAAADDLEASSAALLPLVESLSATDALVLFQLFVAVAVRGYVDDKGAAKTPSVAPHPFSMTPTECVNGLYPMVAPLYMLLLDASELPAKVPQDVKSAWPAPDASRALISYGRVAALLCRHLVDEWLRERERSNVILLRAFLSFWAREYRESLANLLQSDLPERVLWQDRIPLLGGPEKPVDTSGNAARQLRPEAPRFVVWHLMISCCDHLNGALIYDRNHALTFL